MAAEDSPNPRGTDRIDGESLMSHRRRRYLFYCLQLYANPVRLPDIADQLAVWEGADRTESHERRRYLVYETLYHDHLPRLREANAVVYHQVDDTVELGPAFEQIEGDLEAAMKRELPALLSAEDD